MLTIHPGGRDAKGLPYGLNKDDIKADLSDQRPIYPLSCYGPGREAPRQLIEGPVEISPEELRYRWYTARASGNQEAAVCVLQTLQSVSLTLITGERRARTFCADVSSIERNC